MQIIDESLSNEEAGDDILVLMLLMLISALQERLSTLENVGKSPVNIHISWFYSPSDCS